MKTFERICRATVVIILVTTPIWAMIGIAVAHSLLNSRELVTTFTACLLSSPIAVFGGVAIDNGGAR